MRVTSVGCRRMKHERVRVHQHARAHVSGVSASSSLGRERARWADAPDVGIETAEWAEQRRDGVSRKCVAAAALEPAFLATSASFRRLADGSSVVLIPGYACSSSAASARAPGLFGEA